MFLCLRLTPGQVPHGPEPTEETSAAASHNNSSGGGGTHTVLEKSYLDINILAPKVDPSGHADKLHNIDIILTKPEP